MGATLPDELKPASIGLCTYLEDSFGNSTRIDYGSGHESSFAIFLLCLYRIGYFTKYDDRAVVLWVLVKYLHRCRKLKTTYKMEPAGSQAVHSIDDFQFIPFPWGSAQLAGNKSLVPESYLKPTTVEANAHNYLFFDFANFINQHSNQLWNISAVPTWTKVDGGLYKMYEGEVLSSLWCSTSASGQCFHSKSDLNLTATSPRITLHPLSTADAIAPQDVGRYAFTSTFPTSTKN